MSINRRTFLTGTAVGLWALGRPGQAQTAHAAAAKQPAVCVFSKHLQFLDYKTLARTCKDIGLDGVDLTVRAGGHVLPENVEKDLPAAVDAIRAEGLEVPMITTRITNGRDEEAPKILKAASKLGIKFFRIGGHKYPAKGDPQQMLRLVAKDMHSLAELAAECGMYAGYHNHSGMFNVGAPLWDLYQVYREVNSPHIGSNMDLGHATVEGAYGDWQITSRLMAPYTHMMAVKDFVFEKNQPRWVPLGKGIVPMKEMLGIYHDAGFSGPISIHLEYKIPSDDAVIEEVRTSVPVLRKALKAAGYA